MHRFFYTKIIGIHFAEAKTIAHLIVLERLEPIRFASILIRVRENIIGFSSLSSYQSRIAMLFFKQQKRMLLLHKNNTRLLRSIFEKGTQLSPLPAYFKAKKVLLGNVATMQIENLRPNKNAKRILVYIHGGGFVIGSPKSYKGYVASLCQLSQASYAYIPDYRLAPEAKFPAAIDDVFAVWQEICQKYHGYEIVLGGDSAGGNLALALCIRARDMGVTLPQRVYLLSPWLDLTLTSMSHKKQDRHDPFLGTYFLARDFARHYVVEQDRKNPLISPLFANFKGLPSFYVQVGSKEVLLDDSRDFFRKATTQGVEVELDIWTGMWHAWTIVPFVPESQQALKKAGYWLGQRRDI